MNDILLGMEQDILSSPNGRPTIHGMIGISRGTVQALATTNQIWHPDSLIESL